MKNLLFRTALILFALLSGGCNIFENHETPLPSDKAMEENFRSHEADFKKLVTMIGEDAGVKTVYLNGEYEFGDQPHKRGLTAQRISEYRRLLKQANVKSIYHGQTGISFLAWVGGFEHNKAKYYVYSEIPPSPLVDSLDNPGKLPLHDSDILANKKIGENWYLNYWED